MPLLDKIWLGPVELDADLALRGLINWCPVQVTAKRTVDGLLICHPDSMQGGRPLTLDGSGGYFTVGQLRQAVALQALGEPVLLRHHQGNFMVWVLGIEGEDLWIDDVDYADDDQVSAKILLMEVA